MDEAGNAPDPIFLDRIQDDRPVVFPVIYMKNTDTVISARTDGTVSANPDNPMQTAATSRQTTSTSFRARIGFPVILKIRSHTGPPTSSPINPTVQGMMVAKLMSDMLM